MITLQEIDLRRGTSLLLDKANLTVRTYQKMGLIGKNGCGKSSLFALLKGEILPEHGQLDLPKNWKMAWLSQEVLATERTAIDFVLDGYSAFREVEQKIQLAESENDGEALSYLYLQYEELGGYQAQSVAAQLLSGLGFSTAQQSDPVNSFSGGWRMRLNLAQTLILPSDLMLLDEPTNHLDLDAIVWLQGWLGQYQGTLLVISHDRDFLDGVVDSIAYIEQKNITVYTGNYSAFEEQRAARLTLQQSSFEKQQRARAHLQRFIDRFGAKASKAKQSQSRMKQLERMQLVAAVKVDSPFEFSFREPERMPSPLLTLDKTEIGYEHQVALLENIDFTIRPEQRIGLLGPNGAGKSTFIKVLANSLKAISGVRSEGHGLKIGYFEQHQLEQLRLDFSPLQHLQMIDAKTSVQEHRNFLGGFDFRGDKVLEPVAPFSGGEKARLVLAMLVWQRPNLLLLDEPTNHLDLDMREALVSALQAYEGAMVVVSHDRHLLRATCDELWLVSDKQVKPFSGDLDDYIKWLTDKNNTRQQTKTNVSPAQKQQQQKLLEKNLSVLEKEMAKVGQKLEKNRQALTATDLYAGGQTVKLVELHQEEKKLAEELARHEQNWLEMHEALEALNKF